MQNIQHLEEHIDKIQNAKTMILGNWSRNKEVLKVLDRHEMNIQVFLVRYANDIFDYYIAVVKGYEEIGDCPIMSTFLNYLKDNDVKTSELFLICTNFRRAMLDEMFEQNELNKDLFDEISYVFDQNFSGVLDEYERQK